MSLERDLQSELRVTAIDTITVPSAIAVDGTALDTQGVRGIDFVVLMADTTLTGIDITIGFMDSPDGTTWTDVDTEKILPRDAASFSLADIDAEGRYQTWGVTSVNRYLRPRLTGVTVGSSTDIVLVPIKKDEDRPEIEDGIDGNP